MRLTLSIDDDVLAAAKVVAREHRRSIGAVISDLAGRSLGLRGGGVLRNGIPLLTVRPDGPEVTLETVNSLRDELP